MKENEYYVYAWYFKSNNIIFYIGKGKNKRYLEKKNSRNPYFKNILELYKDDCDVKKLYENLTNIDACQLERELISKYKKLGQCCANLHEGGLGGNTGNYNSYERHKKLSEFAATRRGNKNPNFGNKWSDKQKANLSKKIKEKWKNDRSVFMKNRKQGFKHGNIPWNSGKHYKLNSKMNNERYTLMMYTDCPYKYNVYYNNQLVYWCLGRTRLYNFCNEKFSISKTIVKQILNNTWTASFKKHKYLESSLKITKDSISVSTIPDECREVEWRLQPFEVHGNFN